MIRELQWEHLGLMLQDQEHIRIDTQKLEVALAAMAVKGDIGPLVALFQGQVIARIGVKDQRQFNEKTLKLMLLAYLSQSHMFRILSEKEFARGYCDLFLGLTDSVPAARFAWMLEIKYLPTDATRKSIEAAFTQAEAQLDRYTSDTELVPLLTLGKELLAGALLFVGARDVLFRPWPEEEKPPREPAAKGRAPARAKKSRKRR